MDATIPGKSLDAQFDKLWERFERLQKTTDTLYQPSTRLRRWLTPVNVSFIIPIDDGPVCQYLGNAQEKLRAHMNYEPQPPDKLHITLYHLGYLRQSPLPLSGLWSKARLVRIGELAQQYLKLLHPFEIEIGPINAFPNVAIVEVRDQGKLRLLRGVISRAIPPLRLPLGYPLIPHITLGYFGEQPTGPVRETIASMRQWPRFKMRINQVDLTLYNLNRGAYQRSQVLVHSHKEVLASLKIG